ncbi:MULTISPECIES: type II secretion system F family protein [Acidobacterium]|uniref:Putative type 4 fimbrial assembly protein PilC n=1 Tax=Acidobacterium capsulatum (strain ATCC 51196 / DSM 11244 / BCRC 80197 / JCM 7670 / NBRC 15755 / NCIMB 13165 / 161) TaxID=240015 RepID=C1F524_ACIC5|nr:MULTISPECIES: type II secretion system F family protein [Acidobacterium]ACO34073.1 putative type 4 fimbrial assembly protein PilC [Acidobacterium capsulatum ATCC 51196]HCT61881.1 type II secretion system F family protein [Acidobacterium sp.]
MAEFVIKMADERGRVQEQVQSAASAEELRQRFSQAGYYVYSVKPRGLTGTARKIKLEPFLIFNQQFVTLIKAGLPILSSVEMLAQSQKNPHFAAQLQNVAARVRTGESISSAFDAQGGFPPIYTTTLLAGERSGNLEEVLTRYLAFQRISLTFRKKLQASLIYPSMLIVLVFGLFIFLISFVVPRFAMLYDQMGSKLPGITLALLAFGKGTQHYILYILPGVALLVYLLLRWSRTDGGADTIDGIRIRLPIFGMIWLKYQVALFSRTLSTLLMGGLPLVPSLETAARSISSKRIAKAVFNSVSSVREGKGLANSFKNTRVFPALSTEMIEVGESTGALPQMLNSVAEFFEEDVQTALTAALSLIEPAILIVMGIVVVVILIALYLPIFSLGSTSALGS